MLKPSAITRVRKVRLGRERNWRQSHNKTLKTWLIQYAGWKFSLGKIGIFRTANNYRAAVVFCVLWRHYEPLCCPVQLETFASSTCEETEPKLMQVKCTSLYYFFGHLCQSFRTLIFFLRSTNLLLSWRVDRTTSSSVDTAEISRAGSTNGKRQRILGRKSVQDQELEFESTYSSTLINIRIYWNCKLTRIFAKFYFFCIFRL